jgi:hypothetical protein
MEKPHLRHAVLCLRTETGEDATDNYLNALNPVYAEPSISKDDALVFECLLAANLYLPDEPRVYDLEIKVETPDGDTVDLCKDKIETLSDLNYHKITCPVDFLLKSLGTYWFKISLDGSFIGGTSLLVKADSQK